MENEKTINTAEMSVIRRKIKKTARCPICLREFTGDAVIIPAVRGKRLYIHAGCEKNLLTGAPFTPFNTTGGSTHDFNVVVHTTAKGSDSRSAWAGYMRSTGFSTRTGGCNIRAEGTVPAQSISKVLRTLFKMCKSVDIDKRKFKTLDEALKYVKSVTHGNSHNK